MESFFSQECIKSSFRCRYISVRLAQKGDISLDSDSTTPYFFGLAGERIALHGDLGIALTEIGSVRGQPRDASLLY